MQLVAWILLLLPVAIFVGYPALVIAAAATRPPRRPPPARGAPPSITILIGAHNEAATLGDKLASVVAALERWPGQAEVIVADDGSADATAAIAEAHGARVIRCPRGGKARALNASVPHATGDILVMTDADPLFDAGTLSSLLAPFADPAIGAVAGRVETIGKRGRFAAADRGFRRYESTLRGAEDRLFGCISADGGLYAIRRALMPVVPPDVTDDFHISTAAVAAGYRIAYANDARVWEHSIGGGRQQFRRRVRITVRGLTALWRRRALMNPARTGWYAPALLLHKVGRRLAPLCIPPLWLVSLVLATRGSLWWALVATGITAAVAIALAGAAGVKLRGPFKLIHGAMLHLAGLSLGTILFLAGRRYAQWTPQKQP